MLAAMDRVPASIRWAKDCSGDFWQVEDRSGCLKGISVGLSAFCRLAQKKCDSFDGGASLPLRSAGSSRISRHMSVAHSIAFRRRTRSRIQTSSAWRYSHRSYNDAWRGSSSMGRALCTFCFPASPRQPHCSRSCLSRLQFGRPNCAASTQPFSRTACEHLPHSPVTERHVAPIECLVAHLL